MPLATLSDFVGAVFVGAIGALMFILMGHAIGSSQMERFKREAVKRGFADWVVDDNGISEFEWKEKEGE